MAATTRSRALALLVVLGLLASGCGLLPGTGGYEIRTELSRSFNLFPGSPVKVLGVTVGQVSDIIVPDGARTVEVIMQIDPAVDLPEDTTATVVPASLLGERYVQLEPYTDGPQLTEGTVIPVDRTQVPFEFDEVMTGLDNFVGGLEPDEVGRFVGNLAETLEGQGAQLGRTIDSATEAMGVLRDNDAELVELAARLADLNQTLGSRDQELARLLQDYDTVAASLVGDRNDIDAALTGLVRMTGELDGLLQVNRSRLEDDIEVVTRLGRTLGRNADYISLAILSSAELFRHGERIIDRERGFLPLQTQVTALGQPLTEGIIFRIQALCLQAGLPEDFCELELIADLLGGVVCAAPIIPCRDEDDAVPLDEALRNLVTEGPGQLGDLVLGQLTENADAGSTEPEPAPEPTPSVEPSAPEEHGSDEDEDQDEDGPGLLDGLTGLLRGGDR